MPTPVGPVSWFEVNRAEVSAVGRERQRQADADALDSGGDRPDPNADRGRGLQCQPSVGRKGQRHRLELGHAQADRGGEAGTQARAALR